MEELLVNLLANVTEGLERCTSVHARLEQRLERIEATTPTTTVTAEDVRRLEMRFQALESSVTHSMDLLFETKESLTPSGGRRPARRTRLSADEVLQRSQEFIYDEVPPPRPIVSTPTATSRSTANSATEPGSVPAPAPAPRRVLPATEEYALYDNCFGEEEELEYQNISGVANPETVPPRIPKKSPATLPKPQIHPRPTLPRKTSTSHHQPLDEEVEEPRHVTNPSGLG